MARFDRKGNKKSMPLKILFLSAEVAPFAKRGGLGDVAGSLPKALHALGHDVRLVMPAYANIEDGLQSGEFDLRVREGGLLVPLGSGAYPAGVFEGKLPGSQVPIYFIAESSLFRRPEVYGYPDDAVRFSFFSRAALELTQALGWRPDLVHAHDWHTAPAITWLATAGKSDPHFQNIPTLFTIHNLSHQGKTEWQIFDYLGIWSHSLVEEAYGEVNFMARGIQHATMINTVSPTYAKEILTVEGGAGLHGLLEHRSYDVHGILNGLDYALWDPATDPRLVAPFSPDRLEERQANKRALQIRANLPQRDDVPLLGMVSRLDYQKGLDITGHVIHLLLNDIAGEAQFVVLGSGSAEYEQMFANLAYYHPNKMTAFMDYMPELAPIIYGGSDMFLMPSLFEPCGLGQLIAMHYGSVPVVRATGGLVDTVSDGITGYTFHNYEAGAFWEAVERALHTYRFDKDGWQQIQQNGMLADYSWQQSALGYQQLYEWALARAGRKLE
jgi:starch synthase